MKVLQISAIRAIIVLVTGFLLVKYREETMTWMTITVGVLFLLSGLVSCIAYYFEKEKVARKTAKAEQQDGQEEEENLSHLLSLSLVSVASFWVSSLPLYQTRS